MEEYTQETVTRTTEAAPRVSVQQAPVVAPRVPVQQAPVVVAPARTTTERVEQVTVDPYAARSLVLYRMQQAIWTVFAFVEGLIAIRFALRLLGANPGAGFAQLIYGITAPLVAPFTGLFGTPRFEGSAFEFTSLVAIMVYALMAWVMVKLISMYFSETRSELVTRRSETRIQ